MATPHPPTHPTLIWIFGAPPSLDGLVWEWMQLWMATSVIFEIWLLQICKRQKMSVKDWQATSIYRTVLPYYSKSRILQRKSIRVSIIEQNSKKETTLTNFLEEISFLHRGPVAQNYSRIHLITVNSWKGTFRRINMKNISCVHSVDGCWVFTQLDYHQSWFRVEASAHFMVWGVNPLFSWISPHPYNFPFRQNFWANII